MPKGFAPTVVTAIVLGLLLVGARAGSAAGDLAKGKALYDKYCVACHGVQGKGDGPAGRMLKPPAADFTSAASKKKSEAEMTQVIENGKPDTAIVQWNGKVSQPERSGVDA